MMRLSGIAYLRDGERGVTGALVAAAVAAGWSADEVRTIERPSDPLLELHGMLRGVAASWTAVRSAAERVAARHAVWHRSILERAGPWRSKATYARMQAALLAAGGLAFLAGFVRWARAAALHRPFGFLVLEMVLLVVAFPGLLARVRRTKSAPAQRYLGGLGRPTKAVRHQVWAGREEGVDAIATVAAIHGIEALSSVPMFARFVPVATSRVELRRRIGLRRGSWRRITVAG